MCYCKKVHHYVSILILIQDAFISGKYIISLKDKVDTRNKDDMILQL